MKAQLFSKRVRIALRVLHSFLPWRTPAKKPVAALQLKIHRQWTPYSCTAAVFQMVAAYYGNQVTHFAAIQLVGCKPDGAHLSEVAKVLVREFGLKSRNLTTPAQVRKALGSGKPILAHDDNTYSNPHAVLIIGATAKGFWFADPAVAEIRWLHERTLCDGNHEFIAIGT